MNNTERIAGICEICQEISVLKADEFRVERDHWKAQAEALTAELEAKETINRLYMTTLSMQDSKFRDVVKRNVQLSDEFEQKTKELERFREEYIKLNQFETTQSAKLLQRCGELEHKLERYTEAALSAEGVSE